MSASQIAALKLCVEAFHRRLHGSGLNSWDNEAFLAAKRAIKDDTGEIYASVTTGGVLGWAK